MNRVAVAQELVKVAKELVADSGDVPVFFNVFDIFKPIGTAERPWQQAAESILQDAVEANWVEFEKAVKKTLKQENFARRLVKYGLEIR
jgi:hypothetical protein